METSTFYPEMGQKKPQNTQLVVETLYKKYKVTCLNNINLKENRGIEFRYNKFGNNVYYVTKAALNKLKDQYNVSFSTLLD